MNGRTETSVKQAVRPLGEMRKSRLGTGAIKGCGYSLALATVRGNPVVITLE